MSNVSPIHVIGGGLAGSESAFQIASAGVPVVLHEMRPQRMTEAHKTEGPAALVCSNSFRSDDAANNAVGLLHAEMRRLNSIIMSAGDAHQVPAVIPALVADVKQADVPVRVHSREEPHQRAGPFGKLEAIQTFVVAERAPAADHVAQVFLGEIVVDEVQRREAL